MIVNPFSTEDRDRSTIWEMLVRRDIRAFISQDWSATEGDFIREGFIGVDAGYSSDPDGWSMAFPDLGSYRAEWLRQAAAFGSMSGGFDAEAALGRATILRDIEVSGDMALAHKKFVWDALRVQGEPAPANCQTMYHCRRVDGVWKIAGFTGYLPQFPCREPTGSAASIRVPSGAGRHKTSGPYSPVLIVDPGKLVVISGQAAIDREGNIIGTTIEEQAAFTLDNCRKQLASAGCGLDRVFKVAVYLKDMTDWARFNEVYKGYFEGTQPVRTAVQTGLLGTLLVEVECWAVL